MIGQSASAYKHRMKHRRCCLHMDFESYFQCESAYFQKKNFESFILKSIFSVKGA